MHRGYSGWAQRAYSKRRLRCPTINSLEHLTCHERAFRDAADVADGSVDSFGLAPGASPAVTNSGPIRVGWWSSGSHRDAAEDSIRLIREARSIEERSRGLISVTIAKHQCPQARDGERPAVGDRERSHGSRQRGAVGGEDVDRAVAKIADQ